MRAADSRGFVDRAPVIVLDGFVHVSKNKRFKLGIGADSLDELFKARPVGYKELRHGVGEALRNPDVLFASRKLGVRKMNVLPAVKIINNGFRRVRLEARAFLCSDRTGEKKR